MIEKNKRKEMKKEAIVRTMPTRLLGLTCFYLNDGTIFAIDLTIVRIGQYVGLHLGHNVSGKLIFQYLSHR